MVLFNVAKKSPNILHTFVIKFVAKNFQNCPIWSHWRWVWIHCSSIIIQLSSGQIKDTGLNIDQLSLGDTCTIGPIIKQKNRLYHLQRAFFITFVVINRQEILKSFPAGKTEYWMTISPLHCEILEPSLHINSSPRVTPLQQVKCL